VILAPYAESGVLWKIGGCDGGAAWLPPGVAGRFAEIEQSTRAAINSLTGDGGARYAAFWDWLDAHLPREPCWFLDLVGVAPGAQGRGLGRALVRHGLQRARADGCPAFLETGTPRNVPFYEGLGFRVVGAQQAPDGGPVIWFMQTPPAPSSAAIPASQPPRWVRRPARDHGRSLNVTPAVSGAITERRLVLMENAMSGMVGLC
jgi:GNAT superfamily N-acetyltransferase